MSGLDVEQVLADAIGWTTARDVLEVLEAHGLVVVDGAAVAEHLRTLRDESAEAPRAGDPDPATQGENPRSLPSPGVPDDQRSS